MRFRVEFKLLTDWLTDWLIFACLVAAWARRNVPYDYEWEVDNDYHNAFINGLTFEEVEKL